MATRETVTKAVHRLETMSQHLIDTDEVPGLSVAVVHGDEVACAKGFGVRTAGGKEPVDADTVFQLAPTTDKVSSPASVVDVGGT